MIFLLICCKVFYLASINASSIAWVTIDKMWRQKKGLKIYISMSMLRSWGAFGRFVALKSKLLINFFILILLQIYFKR